MLEYTVIHPKLLRPICPDTVMILSFWIDRSWRTVQTQIRLKNSLIRVYTVCNSDYIFWMHDSKVEPHCSNFRISTAVFRVSEFLGVLRYLWFVWYTKSHVPQLASSDWSGHWLTKSQMLVWGTQPPLVTHLNPVPQGLGVVGGPGVPVGSGSARNKMYHVVFKCWKNTIT